MCGNGIFAQPLGQVEGDTLGEFARVDEYQGRAVLQNEFRDAVVDLVPHLMRSNGPEWDSGDFNPEIKLALVSDVDDHRDRTTAASKKVRDLLDGLLRR